MNAFIDEHREALGIEPICNVLQVAPSAYRRHAAERRDPTRRCARARRDETLMGSSQNSEKIYRDFPRSQVR